MENTLNTTATATTATTATTESDLDFDCTKPVYMQLPRFNEKRDLLNDSMED